MARDGRALWWTLRVGAALCFIGHGAFGILTKEAWVPFFGFVGLGRDAAFALMPLVGVLDITAGCLLLISPRRAVLLYMTGWALWTAALRPLTGDSVLEMLERAGNYGVPLAMLLMCARRSGWRGWLAPVELSATTPALESALRLVLTATTVLLLVGHGGLGLVGKAALTAHYASIGFEGDAAARVTPFVGMLELSLAGVLLVRPSAGLGLIIAGWKLATESLWLVDGAPVWEFVERAGSYAAPLGVAVLLRPRVPIAPVSTPALSRVARLNAVLIVGLAGSLIAPLAAQAQEREAVPPSRRMPLDDGALLAALREGGLVLACRHGITESNKDDTGSERELQRNLNDEGRLQAVAMGRAIRAARVPIGPVLSSPMFRTKETAELAFGESAVTLSKLLLRGKIPLDGLISLYTDAPPTGTNRVLMTHQGPLYRMLTALKSPEIAEGDCAVVRATPAGVLEVLAKLGVADWERLARR
jgi:phosphohistidine phosphatase SixA